ncbi:MAG: type II toxin-antitoxin system RelE/ParE family toxin [Clostridiales bacterium]|jgi:mRNA interferase RelE/StbE|nr:type II toxin-antitoxin system RelE/ParE family toxin [Clostridiales bacterium]
MKFELTIDKTALKFIAKQPPKEKIRILRAINKLPEGDVLKMSGKYNLYRLRVGGYRIIYTIEEEVFMIRVIEAGNRGDIY